MDTTDINDQICRRLDDLTRRLDELEASLPPVAARTLRLSRATAHRVNSTASDVANDVGEQLGKLSSTSRSALSTTAGQARSALDRTASTARRTGKETVGQARAQGERTAGATEDAVGNLLDDAARTIEPADRSSRPAQALSDWTKDELYEEARQLDIEGRSGMNKRELIDAISRT
jgi:hypothetical protein